MFVSEIPNKPKAFGFAATKRWSPFVTTIASGELANNFRKPFSLSRIASFSLWRLSATLLASLVRVFCARRRCTPICSNAINNPDLNLAICMTRLPVVSRILFNPNGLAGRRYVENMYAIRPRQASPRNTAAMTISILVSDRTLVPMNGRSNTI